MASLRLGTLQLRASSASATGTLAQFGKKEGGEGGKPASILLEWQVKANGDDLEVV